MRIGFARQVRRSGIEGCIQGRECDVYRADPLWCLLGTNLQTNKSSAQTNDTIAFSFFFSFFWYADRPIPTRNDRDKPVSTQLQHPISLLPESFLFQSTPKFIFLELIGPYKRGLWPVLDNQVEENLSGTCLSIPGTQGGFPPTLGVISDFFLLGLNN